MAYRFIVICCDVAILYHYSLLGCYKWQAVRKSSWNLLQVSWQYGNGGNQLFSNDLWTNILIIYFWISINLVCLNIYGMLRVFSEEGSFLDAFAFLLIVIFFWPIVPLAGFAEILTDEYFDRLGHVRMWSIMALCIFMPFILAWFFHEFVYNYTWLYWLRGRLERFPARSHTPVYVVFDSHPRFQSPP